MMSEVVLISFFLLSESKLFDGTGWLLFTFHGSMILLSFKCVSGWSNSIISMQRWALRIKIESTLVLVQDTLLIHVGNAIIWICIYTKLIESIWIHQWSIIILRLILMRLMVKFFLLTIVCIFVKIILSRPIGIHAFISDNFGWYFILVKFRILQLHIVLLVHFFLIISSNIHNGISVLFILAIILFFLLILFLLLTWVFIIFRVIVSWMATWSAISHIYLER